MNFGILNNLLYKGVFMKENVQKQRLSNFFILVLKNISSFSNLEKKEIIKKIKEIRINYAECLAEKEEIKKTSVNASIARALNIAHGKYLTIDSEIFKKINFLIR